MYPKLVTDLDILHGNAKNIVQISKDLGISIIGITKGFCGDIQIAKVLEESGVAGLGDSRMKNIISLREGGIKVPLWLLRIPMQSEVDKIAHYVDGLYISELSTAQKLSEAAQKAGREIDLILMVEMGDLREGILKENLFEVAREMSKLPNLNLQGIGSNFACYGGVIPTTAVLQEMVDLQEKLRKELGLPLPILSGGNSSSVGLLPWKVPAGVTQLRLGEAILFGQEACERKPISGSSQDGFTLFAEVVEVQIKNSIPTGEIGIDAFGKVPQFKDRGSRKRAIVAVGRQDTVPEDLFPLWGGVEILGASSDHMLLDVENASPEVTVGMVIPFRIRYYSGMLQGFTSDYVTKEYKQT